MAKRLRSWDNDIERQKKIFVSEKYVNLNNADYMKKVYEKTLLCLYKGSNNLPSEISNNQTLDAQVKDVEEGDDYLNPLDMKRLLPIKTDTQTNEQKYSNSYPEEEKNSLTRKSRNYRQLRLDKLWMNQKQVEFSYSNEEGGKVEPKIQ